MTQPTSPTFNSWHDYAHAAGSGALRSLITNTPLYPLEVIKTNQQAHPTPLKVHQAITKLYAEGGLSSFTKGYVPQMGKSLIRQIWWTPTAVHLPPYLKAQGLPSVLPEIVTGIFAASLDSLNTPLELWRIRRGLQMKNTWTLPFTFKEAYNGTFAYWRRQSIGWSALLAGKEILNEGQKKTGVELTPTQLLKTSATLALLLSVINTPADTANTLKQGKNISLFTLIQNQKPWDAFRHLYRGFPVIFGASIAQTFSTVFLFNYLAKTRNKAN